MDFFLEMLWDMKWIFLGLFILLGLIGWAESEEHQPGCVMMA